MTFALLVALGVAPVGGGSFLNVDGESAARMVFGLSLPSPVSREATARGFLADNAGALGLLPEDELALSSDEAQVVTFERRRGGVPVLGSEVKATFDEADRLVLIDVGAPLGRTHGRFLVDAPRAEAVAARGFEGIALAEARRVWLHDPDGLQAVWLVRFSAGPAEPMRAYVDAETGRLLHRHSERLSAGMGSVYDVSPAKGPVVTRALGGLPANASTLMGARAIARSCDGAGIGGGCTPRATANASFDFVYTPNFLVSNTDRFGEVNAYYATDRFAAWLSALDAGYTLRPIDIYTNVGSSDQGYFLGGGARYGIELGQGPEADWAYEGDVIFHELGHGVVQGTSGFGFYGSDMYGINAEGGSLNEGSADCLALGLTNDPVLADFVGPYLADAGKLTTPYLRRMDGPITCHGRDGNLDGGDPGRFGEIHDDGRILGSFFWALHSRSQALGPYAASGAFLRALRSVTGSAGFHEVAQAVRTWMSMRSGAQAEALVTCLMCERDLPGCDTRTRRIYDGETHETRLLGGDSIAPTMGNGERPQSFQYELAVPANATVTFDRFAVTEGMPPKLYARFGQRVTWSGGSATSEATITTQGQSLPVRATAGTWYLQGALVDPGNGTRRFGLRAQVTGATPIARPAASGLTCSLGGGTGSCTCMPSCAGKTCGSDGCGGMCGSCDAGTMCNGSACACIPQCAGKVCGPDGCGGSCGTCANGACDAGVCTGCTPVCTGKACGPNGCGQACGQCLGDNEICELATGQCVDAGALPVGDGGTGGGSGGGAGGGAEEVRGSCGCGAAPSFGLLALAAALLLRRKAPVRGMNAP